jgi:hypothetical protein
MTRKELVNNLAKDIDDVLDWVLRLSIPDKATFLDELMVVIEDKKEREWVRANAAAAFQVVAPAVKVPNMSSIVQRLELLRHDSTETLGIQSAATSALASCGWAWTKS